MGTCFHKKHKLQPNFHQKQCFIFPSAYRESRWSCQAITSCFFPFSAQDSPAFCGNYGRSEKGWLMLRARAKLQTLGGLSGISSPSESFSSNRTVESPLDTAREILRGAVTGARGLLNPSLDPGRRIQREKGGENRTSLWKQSAFPSRRQDEWGGEKQEYAVLLPLDGP